MILSYFLGSQASEEDSRTPNSADQQQQQSQQQPSSQNEPPSRQHRQPPPTNLKLLFGGMTFFAISLFITRRALRKRHLAAIPPYYTSSVYHRVDVNGAVDAFEAFNLATINVFSFSMMGTGAVMYKLGINDLEDARRIVRRAYIGEAAGGATGGNWNAEEDALAEKEIEAWVVETLGLKGYEEKKKEILNKRLEEEAGKGT